MFFAEIGRRMNRMTGMMLTQRKLVLPEFSGRSLLAKPTSLAAPIRAGLASPLRVATGGAANCGSGVRPRRSPAPANTRRAVGSGRDWQRGLQKQA
jgi:hypothetical protein